MERVALTYEQIKDPCRPLPQRPPKPWDGRTPWFEEMFDCGCVELDALPPEELSAIVRQALLDTVQDQAAWAAREARFARRAAAHARLPAPSPG